MASSFNISGVAWVAREKSENGLLVLSEKDHLLRRFGAVKVFWFKKDDVIKPEVSVSTDILLCVIEGKTKISLIDEREQSPTFKAEDTESVDKEPSGILLVPFGVKVTIEAKEDGQMLAITSEDI